MPELPEVETVRSGLSLALAGATIEKVTLRRGNLRIPFPAHFAKNLANRTIISIERRAKYLLFILDSEDVLIAHLGMSGRFLIEAVPPHQFAAHDHVIFTLNDSRTLIYNDARRFGLMTLAKRSELASHPLFVALGVEPFDRAFSPAYLQKTLENRRSPIKVALMDQALVVGVGNIYASEALFLAKIDPRKPAYEASKDAKSLILCIRKVLQDAIASGGSSLRDFLHISGKEGYFQHHFNVYGRKDKPCFVCNTPIRGIRLGGRSTFFCPNCQK